MTLNCFLSPDEIASINIDRRTLPHGDYIEAGYETRQVFDIRISRHVTEYRAQILEATSGKRFVATFPPGVSRATQYGASIKANAVYMSMFQLIPYERIQTHFRELFNIPISSGSLVNFNADAYQRLDIFETLAKKKLRNAEALHVDETGVNVDGKRLWLHNASNEKWTLIAVHAKRGKDAMDEMGVLPHFRGLLIHDHWKPYYRYDHCEHVLCNAHHKRELTRAHEQDGQKWALKMEDLLDQINTEVKLAGGALQKTESQKWRRKYRSLLKAAETECSYAISKLIENEPSPSKAKVLDLLCKLNSVMLLKESGSIEFPVEGNWVQPITVVRQVKRLTSSTVLYLLLANMTCPYG